MEVEVDALEVNEILEILEEMDDEVMAVALLKEFNEKKENWGRVFLDKSGDLKTKDWKRKCDKAKSQLDEVITKIRKYKKEQA